MLANLSTFQPSPEKNMSYLNLILYNFQNGYFGETGHRPLKWAPKGARAQRAPYPSTEARMRLAVGHLNLFVPL